MCMGVATANSILVVSFARERLEATGDAVTAAMEAGFTRFRPVLMTALAMIIGMAPMALGLGEGGEQNAPLGRAVIGGLICATIATLLFVPVVLQLVHGRKAESPGHRHHAAGPPRPPPEKKPMPEHAPAADTPPVSAQASETDRPDRPGGRHRAGRRRADRPRHGQFAAQGLDRRPGHAFRRPWPRSPAPPTAP
ncbi:MAG: efflux RND transporter permease subunit [Caulobacteraceae bacterium]